MSIALAAWLLVSPARAVDGGAVGVAVVGAHVGELSLEENQRLAEHLGEALNATGVFEAINPVELSERLRGRQELVLSDYASGRGKEWLEEGKILSDRFLFDQSIPALQRATRAFEEGVLLTGDVNLLAEAWLALGLAHAGYGQSEEAMEAFRQVVTLQPTRQLSEMEYPPKYVRLFQSVREEVLLESPASLSIEVRGGPFAVEVDGRAVGLSPVVVRDLPPGRHFLRVLGEGMDRVQGSLTLEAGETKELDLKLKPGRLGSAAESEKGRSRQLEALYSTMGRYAEVPMVLLAGQTVSGELSLVLFSLESGVFSEPVSTRGAPENLVNLVAELAGLLSESGSVRGSRVSAQLPGFDLNSNAVLSHLLLAPPLEVAVSSAPSAGRSNWWIWAGAGALSVGGAALVAAIVSKDEDTVPGGTIVFGPVSQ
ncbi:MAG: PEGA domain-containing protein [Myxococcota bacterium]|nr:PEGA domain-containing protein [Myxococcota bacterium]